MTELHPGNQPPPDISLHAIRSAQRRSAPRFEESVENAARALNLQGELCLRAGAVESAGRSALLAACIRAQPNVLPRPIQSWHREMHFVTRLQPAAYEGCRPW